MKEGVGSEGYGEAIVSLPMSEAHRAAYCDVMCCFGRVIFGYELA